MARGGLGERGGRGEGGGGVDGEGEECQGTRQLRLVYGDSKY